MNSRSPGSNPLTPPSVVGLEGSRVRAHRAHRRKRAVGRLGTGVAAVVGCAVVAGGAWIGYTIYEEQQASDTAERELRITELQARRENQTTEDLLEEVGNAPRWNGNPPPALGVPDFLDDDAPTEP